MTLRKLLLGTSITIAMIGPLCSTGWAQSARSEYTSLAGCKVLWHAAANEPLPNSFNPICPGRDGMRVILEGGDARSWIGLVPPGAKSDQGKRLYNVGVVSPRSLASVWSGVTLVQSWWL